MSRSKLVEQWLRDALSETADFKLERIAELVLPVKRLRELCKQHDKAPKGYRIDRAPAKRLANLLCDKKSPDAVRSLVEALIERLDQSDDTAPEAVDQEELARTKRLLALRDQEIDEFRGQLDRARELETQRRQREASLVKEAEIEREKQAFLKSELATLQQRLERRRRPTKDSVAQELQQRVNDLERELEALAKTEEGLRRIVALRQARIRDLEERNQELLELAKSKKRKPPEPKPEEPALSDTFRVPRFSAAFYKSLEGKPQQAIEKAFQSALLFCIEGPSYPGLEVKQMGGQATWSLRASRKLRVYFLPLEKNEVEFLALVDREDQPTTLRRLKDR